MKSDVIIVSSRGSQMEKALAQAEKVAAFKGLAAKDALHLRLLTEEMMGMMRGITGETEGEFWIEENKGVYQLHLLVDTQMDAEKREKLLAASTSGKNEAARGLMGRLRAFFDAGSGEPFMPMLHAEGLNESTNTTLDWEWKMTVYQHELEKWADKNPQARAIWDELEQSVVTHVADEVKVSLRGQQAELIIIKEMKGGNAA